MVRGGCVVCRDIFVHICLQIIVTNKCDLVEYISFRWGISGNDKKSSVNTGGGCLADAGDSFACQTCVTEIVRNTDESYVL